MGKFEKHTEPAVAKELIAITVGWVMAAAACAALIEAGLLLLAGQTSMGSVAEGALAENLTFGKVVLLFASCAETGVVEEVLFRGALLFASVKLLSLPRCPVRPSSVALVAAVISAAAFGFAHLSGISFAAPDMLTVASAMLKCVQGAMFGFCMAAVALVGRTVLVPIVLHAAFDVVYFSATFFSTGVLPSSYTLASVAEALPLIATILLFLPPVLAGVRVLRGYVVGLPRSA